MVEEAEYRAETRPALLSSWPLTPPLAIESGALEMMSDTSAIWLYCVSCVMREYRMKKSSPEMCRYEERKGHTVRKTIIINSTQVENKYIKKTDYTEEKHDRFNIYVLPFLIRRDLLTEM